MEGFLLEYFLYFQAVLDAYVWHHFILHNTHANELEVTANERSTSRHVFLILIRIINLKLHIEEKNRFETNMWIASLQLRQSVFELLRNPSRPCVMMQII